MPQIFYVEEKIESGDNIGGVSAFHHGLYFKKQINLAIIKLGKKLVSAFLFSIFLYWLIGVLIKTRNIFEGTRSKYLISH